MKAERLARVCPVCGRTYTEYPALSRKDNETEICPECGTREALDIFGISEEEKTRIIELQRGARNETD